ncbi:hypothetical protein IC620_13655 [Hazenella sp. IB182357]|uniref:Uncharacterized protein n=1 Tax=Polycladospora coralii TaxID=2771432 RepID=A0A926RU00_9BACL|nr:hypothetical protein [Polycladospora coralii]MBD1373395.1 hypothetical protein [Polycladospora coralii]
MTQDKGSNILLFCINLIASIYMMGVVFIVLFAGYVFNEGIAESSQPYALFFWVVLFLNPIALYFLVRKQFNRVEMAGWSFLSLGLLTTIVIIHDLANGYENGDNPMVLLAIPSVIFILTGIIKLYESKVEKPIITTT